MLFQVGSILGSFNGHFAQKGSKNPALENGAGFRLLQPIGEASDTRVVALQSPQTLHLDAGQPPLLLCKGAQQASEGVK